MKENLNISISSITIVKVFVWLCVFMALFYLSDFVVSVLVAVVLAFAVEPPIKFLKKHKIPRWVSVPMLFVVIIVMIGVVISVFIPPLVDDFTRFVRALPVILDSVKIFGNDLGLKDLSLYISDLSRDISKGQIITIIKEAFFGTSSVFATTSILIERIVNIILTLVLSFYFALEEGGVKKFLTLILPESYESYVGDLCDRVQNKISLWAQGQFLLSFFVALLVYVPLLVLSFPYAALLATLAFIGEFIPMVGLTMSMIPAFFIAWSHGGIDLFLIILGFYVIVSQLESHILYPRVMNKMVGVPSVLVIIAIVIGAKLAGIWGVILAVPFAAVVMELANDIEKKKHHA